MTAVRSKREPNKWTDAGWASRLDLANAVTSRYAKSGNFVEAKTLKVEVITNAKANEIKKSKVTDADKRATKVAAKLRKAGIIASKSGTHVRVHVPLINLGDDHPARVPGWYFDYFSEGSKINRRSQRIARLIARHAAAQVGYQLDKNCWTVVL
jgi:NaMN:DMB phosphoribosyltransferase